jgi:Sec-independent protein secretion pathway component TatC
MKTTRNFIINAVKTAVVFMVIFAMPAIMIALLWLDLSLYKACMHSPSYCTVMFIIAGLVTLVYTDIRVEKSK